MSTPVKVDKKIEKAAKKKLKEWEQEQKKEQKKLDKQQRKKGELSVEDDKTTSIRSSSVSVPSTPSRSVSYQSSMDYPPKEGPTLPISAALDQLFDKDDQIASQEEDSFLTALVVETEIEPAVKAVFESGKEKEYVNKLDQYIIRKEKEIEDICSRNYQTFISAVDELLQVRAETEDLKDNTVKLDEELQHSGKLLQGKYKELLKHRRMQYNMALAVEVVQDCQYLLSLIAKVNESLAGREFYPALRYLEHLQKVHLPRVQEYSFVQYFQNMIPIWEDQIRKGALDDANNWLLSLRDVSSDVGKFALEQTEAQIKQEESIQVVTENGTATPQMLTKKKSNLIFKNDFVEESLFHNSRFKVDFSALHQCMHIYSTMGIQSQFEAYYRDNRKQQAHSVLKPRERIQELSALKPYFHKVCGFYVIEATVYQTANNLMPRSQLDKMWEQAVVTIKSVIQEQMAYTIEPDIIYELKEFVVLFCKTVQSYGYNIVQLFDFIETMKEAYVELSVNKYNTDFVRVLDSEKWEPLTIYDKKDYESLILANKLQVNNEKTMPQSFIFTKIVPMYSNLIKSFISDFYKFGKGLQSIDEYVKKATERLIKMYTQGLLSYTEHSTAISQLGLAWTNLLYLEVLCKGEWEDYLAKYSHHGKLKFLHAFEQSRKQVEGWIHDAMKKKIQDFTSLSISLNWIPAAPVTEPRDYINDLVLFMDTSFSVLNALSTNVQEAIQTKAIGNTVSCLLEVLLNEQVKNWNTAGIKALELEIHKLEQFTEKTKVTNSSTAEIFGEIKQLLSLLGQDVLDGFMDPNVKKQQYSKLTDYAKLLKILEKYREDRGYFTRKTPKEKSIDTVKEYLRREMKNVTN